MQTYKRGGVAAVLCALALGGCGNPSEEKTPKDSYTVQTCAEFHFKVADESESKAARQLLHALSMEDPHAHFSDEDSRWGVRVVIRRSQESPPKFLLLSRKGIHHDERDMQITHIGRSTTAQDGTSRSSCDDAKDKADFARIASAFGEKWRLRAGPIPLRRNPLRRNTLPSQPPQGRTGDEGQAAR